MMTIYDLIYSEFTARNCEDAIREQYPQAVLKDASDNGCLGRFSVEMEVDKNEWLSFLFTSGIFGFSLMSHQERFEDTENYMCLMKQAVEIKETQSE